MIKLAQIYDRAGYVEYAERVGRCGTCVSFNSLDPEGIHKSVRRANFCHVRLCPMCTARKAKKNAVKLSRIMDAVEAEHENRYIFLTLTVRNCPGDKLGETITLLTKSWDRLRDQRKVQRAVKGWFRAIEITRKPKNPPEHEYHPHIHAIIAVENEYFGKNSPLYIDDWIQRWAAAVRGDYEPSIKVKAMQANAWAKSKGDCDSPTWSASLEAAKYATKDCEYIDKRLSIDKAAQIVKTYTNALHGRRLTAFGGWLKDVARAFEAEDMDSFGDLADDGTPDRIRDDLANYILQYKWSVGAGGYILASRQLNPLRIDLQEGEELPAAEYFDDPDYDSCIQAESEYRAEWDRLAASGMTDDEIREELRAGTAKEPDPFHEK